MVKKNEIHEAVRTIVDGKVYNIREVADILRFNRHTIYKMIQSGKLKAIRAGDKCDWRVFGLEILNFIRGGHDVDM